MHEYLPAAAWTKGDAVRWIAHDVERRTGQQPWVAYFGDDLTDEDAFRASPTAVGGRRPPGVGAPATGSSRRPTSPLALADLAEAAAAEASA